MNLLLPGRFLAFRSQYSSAPLFYTAFIGIVEEYNEAEAGEDEVSNSDHRADDEIMRPVGGKSLLNVGHSSEDELEKLLVFGLLLHLTGLKLNG